MNFELRINRAQHCAGPCLLSPGGVLLSQGSSPQVSSALEVLTVVFGMGTRVSPPPLPPDFRLSICFVLLHLSKLSMQGLVPCKPDNDFPLCFPSSPTPRW